MLASSSKATKSLPLPSLPLRPCSHIRPIHTPARSQQSHPRQQTSKSLDDLLAGFKLGIKPQRVAVVPGSQTWEALPPKVKVKKEKVKWERQEGEQVESKWSVGTEVVPRVAKLDRVKRSEGRERERERERETRPLGGPRKFGIAPGGRGGPSMSRRDGDRGVEVRQRGNEGSQRGNEANLRGNETSQRGNEVKQRGDGEGGREQRSLADRAADVDVGVEGEDYIPDPTHRDADRGGAYSRTRSTPESRKKSSNRGSIHSQAPITSVYGTGGTQKRVPIVMPKEFYREKKRRVVEERVEREVFIPSSIRVGEFARVVDVRLGSLQRKMAKLGMSEDQCHSDYLLTSEDASLIAMEYGLNPIVDNERSFDIYPDPPVASDADLPQRPPVVTIMGHVDHGKTTLLDSLRKTSVASGEAGGITQHIGAFSVSLASMLPSTATPDASITFLDTPGHAAFTAMRARGASVTDIVVLVVAADDGVMPQTKEVLELVKAEGDKVGLVVAINKCDKQGVNIDKVKSALGQEGLFLEEDGGDVPSVRVSGLKGTGLDELVETLSTVAEVRDLKASKESKAEGYVLESRVEKGRGAVATVLVLRGTLKTGSSVVAGSTWCKVRQITDDKGKHVSQALPGMPVIVAGWQDVPVAGDEMLEAVGGADEAKRAIANRKRDAERKALMRDVEQINEKRRAERERIEREEAAAEAVVAAGGDPVAAAAAAARAAQAEERANGFKELRLIIKADVSGTVEAVVGSLEGIGNKEAGVKIVQSGVGDVTEADVALAEAAEGMIIGFSVKAPRGVQNLAGSSSVPIHLETVIYRLIETVRSKVAALLPPIIETRVLGEAVVQQIFSISLKGKEVQVVAGCRIGNGAIGKNDSIRVLRGAGREVVHEGKLDSLKHMKKDITEAKKGSECGLSLEGFTDVKEGDVIVAFSTIEKPREL